MRAFIRSVAPVLLFTACAHVEAPRGGPEDRTPPTVASTVPAADTVVAAFNAPVLFQFSERISQERIADAVAVSPRTSPVVVSHGRSSVRVSLRNGWEAGQIYHVTVNRTLRDLFGNPLPEAETLVFSTGPEIPDTRLEGVVYDRLTGRPVVDARVEAIRAADSLVYAVQSDTAGVFAIERFPGGDYRIRAYVDANRNRSIEAFEAGDSTDVTIATAEPAIVALRVLEGDSTSAVITSVEVDSLQLNVEFDDFLDPGQQVTSAQVVVAHPVSGAVGVDSVRVASEPGPRDNDELLPSRTLEVFLSPDVVLDPSAEYEVTVTSVRNVNGLVGDSEDTFEPPEPPEPPEPAEPADTPAAGVPAAWRERRPQPVAATPAAAPHFVARATLTPPGIPPPSLAPQGPPHSPGV